MGVKTSIWGRVLSCWSQWESTSALSQSAFYLPPPYSSFQTPKDTSKAFNPSPHRPNPSSTPDCHSGSALVGELNRAVSILLGSQRSELDGQEPMHMVFVISAFPPPAQSFKTNLGKEAGFILQLRVAVGPLRAAYTAAV